MVPLVNSSGFLGRYERAGQPQRPDELLDEQVVPDKTLKIAHTQVVRRQDLLRKGFHRHRLPAATQGAQHLARHRRHRIGADVDAELVGLLNQQQAHVGFALHVSLRHVGFLAGEFPVMKQVEQLEFVQGLQIGMLRDHLPVDGAEVAARAPAAAADLRRARAPIDEGNNCGGDDDGPKPFRMFANCPNHK